MNASIRRSMLTAGLALAATAPAVRVVAQNPAPAPQVTVSGVAYGQYVYQLKDTAGHQNEFDVTRAYLNVLGKFSGGVSTRVTADVFTSGTSLAYRLKYAFVGWTPEGSALTYKFGLFTTPWLDWEEALWDYRMEGPMALDRNKYVTSSDFGAGFDGSWRQDLVNAQVGVFNGEGYSGGPGDKRKDVEGRVSVRLVNTDDMSRVGGLRITGYAGIGTYTGGGNRNRFIGMVSYRSKQVTLAAEYASTKDTVTANAPGLTGFPGAEVTAMGASATGNVLSAFGVYHFANSPVAVIARVDYVKLNTAASDTLAGIANTRLIAGLSYQLSPNLRVLGDVDLLSYKNGSPTPALDAARQQAYFQAQFTF